MKITRFNFAGLVFSTVTWQIVLKVKKEIKILALKI
jgi:hypothetical protein